MKLRLRGLLLEWLGITALDAGLTSEEKRFDVLRDRVSDLAAQLGVVNAEIDRLRSMICETPQPAARVIHRPHTWNQAKNLR